MKNLIKWILCLLAYVGLTVATSQARDLPADILTEVETHGKKHLRLMEIPSDEKANSKTKKGENDCFDDYCLAYISEEKTDCIIHYLPSWRKEDVSCMEWQKGYDKKGILRTYTSYKIDSKTKERNRKYFVEWNENKQVNRICDYDNHICQYFDANGKLIKDCYVGRGFGYCSEYNEDTEKWDEVERWMA